MTPDTPRELHPNRCPFCNRKTRSERHDCREKGVAERMAIERDTIAFAKKLAEERRLYRDA